MIVWMLACSLSPYSDYWPDRSEFPIIERVSPEVVESRAGGQAVQIEGRKLSNATTVVVGGRNAEIISVDDRIIQARLPDLPPGPDSLAVSVVTGNGASTKEGALSVSTFISDFVQDESVSVNILRLDCPAEAWGTYEDGEEFPYGWCGSEMGFVSAEAWLGIGSQSGFAADTSGVSPLSELPASGETRVYDPGDRLPATVPLVFAAHGSKEAVLLEQERNFEMNLSILEDRRLLFEDTYYWWDSITEWVEYDVRLMDEAECWIESLSIAEVDQRELTLSGDAGDATHMTVGFAFEEDYGDYVYAESAPVFGAEIVTDGARVRSVSSGVELGYDATSGWFLPDRFVGPGDLVPGEYRLTIKDARGQRSEEGYVMGMTPLNVETVTPRLMTGYEAIDVTTDLEVSWEPAPPTKSPTMVAVEVAVYDMDVANPNGMTLVGRLVASAPDATGKIVIKQADLARLPLAPNQWDQWDEAQGYWGDMTITRHELRKIRRGQQGDVVVDFIHAINGPVVLFSEP
jgi:hypothetical protein